MKRTQPFQWEVDNHTLDLLFEVSVAYTNHNFFNVSVLCFGARDVAPNVLAASHAHKSSPLL